MRFPRNASLFRGQLDLAPLAGVFFLLLIFILLGSLIYTPGISYQLDTPVPVSQSRASLSIAKNGTIHYEGKTFRIEELEQLRSEFKKLPAQSTVVISAEPGAPRQLAVLVRDQLKGLPARVVTPDTPIELPKASGLAGTTNPTVVVAVNLGGQLFYRNRLMQEAELERELESAVRKSAEPLTLLVMADQAAHNQVVMRLGELARRVGIKEMLVAAAPKKP